VFPVLFRLGPVTIYAYGAMLLLAFAAGELLAQREARRRGLNPELILDLAIWVLVSSLVFARLTYILFHLADYARYPRELLFAWSGLSFHGGLFGGVLAGWLFARRRKVSFLALADTVTPSLALGYAIARIGCFLNGCCYGGPTDLPWGVIFPSVLERVHPVQLYDSFANLLLFLALWRLRGRLAISGQLFFLYLGLYSIIRFFMEILRRGYTSRTLFDSITAAQLASIALLALSAWMMWRLWRRAASAPRADG
jgi:phosphatidylglycerol:prolipoprotein diacylglycerol transferase